MTNREQRTMTEENEEVSMQSGSEKRGAYRANLHLCNLLLRHFAVAAGFVGEGSEG